VYDRRVEEVTTFILAGGRSTRMGRDKALLVLNGQTLVERAVELGSKVAGEVWIVGDPKKFSRFGRVVGDVYQERGPLGGIHVALSSTKTEWNLMVAVDLPSLKADFLRWLVEQAQADGAVVTVPHAAGHLQPLCAVYRKQFAQAAQTELEAGRNKIDPLFGPGDTRIIQESELVYHGFSTEMFRNVNTPEEWTKIAGN